MAQVLAQANSTQKDYSADLATMKSLFHLLLALLPCCDGTMLLNAGGHALQVHSSVFDETFGLTSQTASDDNLEVGLEVEQAKPKKGKKDKKGIRYTGDLYKKKKAMKIAVARKRAFKKKMKARSVLRKKCGKCMKGKAKCTGKCKKFKNRNKPKSRKTCKGKACYRKKFAGTASKKRRRAFKKKMKVRSVLRKKCGKCMKGKAKCTGKCKKFRNRRRPLSRKTRKSKVCYLR